MSIVRARVRDRRDLARDPVSRAIINVDADALNKYREERDRARRLERLLDEHDRLKAEMAEMRSMLAQILERVG